MRWWMVIFVMGLIDKEFDRVVIVIVMLIIIAISGIIYPLRLSHTLFSLSLSLPHSLHTWPTDIVRETTQGNIIIIAVDGSAISDPPNPILTYFRTVVISATLGFLPYIRSHSKD